MAGECYEQGQSTMHFDHIGIFVKEIDFGVGYLQKFLPITKLSQIFQDPLLNVTIQFCYDDSGICYELVAPFGEKNPVETALQHNNVLNHVAYRSDDFDLAVENLREAGCMPLGPARPAVAFGGKQVIFFLTPLKLIIEIIER